MREYYKQWKEWSWFNTNSRLHQILVLLKLRKSPSFEAMRLSKDCGQWMMEGLKKGLENPIALSPEFLDQLNQKWDQSSGEITVIVNGQRKPFYIEKENKDD